MMTGPRLNRRIFSRGLRQKLTRKKKLLSPRCFFFFTYLMEKFTCFRENLPLVIHQSAKESCCIYRRRFEMANIIGHTPAWAGGGPIILDFCICLALTH